MDLESEIFEQFTSDHMKSIHIISSNFQAVKIAKHVTETLGYRFFHLLGFGIRDRETLFDVIERLMEFPYFGRNWDALSDCLGGLEWLPASGYVILYEEPQHLFKTSKDVLMTFFEIIISSAKEWSMRGVPFFLVCLDKNKVLDSQNLESFSQYVYFYDE